METLSVGQTKLTWLNGGVTHLDGGAMFGVVPKPLWSKKYPVNEKNQIELRTDPILIQKHGLNILIETGIGINKMNDKLKRNYGVTEESSVESCLKELNLSPAHIDMVIMTHMHYDHACGLSKWEKDQLVSTFPNAKIITSKVEWEEMINPNIRSVNTYWKENWQAIEGQVELFEDEIEVLQGIKVIHTGGHSDGHSIVVIHEEDEKIFHMADLMPTHAHNKPLWVLAYDDYPMTSIEQKIHWIPKGMKGRVWFTFYHDAYYRAIKWDENGEVVDKVLRKRN
ncbi:MBL fold metallo-hydrolase [Bacillus carboniphilus]|uniref:MBL fold metallo-hydrolase n=1 Tax=Bacillus carboniphilus TaxID=86663 RepID=A0ABY9JS03_9BACI|nr:MBL fold metallo-hydrolase [Bacillus carboniphilus]WLR41147.1 MBL fold metallo-hydrolase [Bacillus carboniphilus]